MNQDEARFWSNVDKNGSIPEHVPELGPCWMWTGGHSGESGYGEFYANGVSLGAHRFAWILTYGLISDGLFVLHKCDVRTCVRYTHLFLGTQTDNMLDAARKGRNPMGERHGCHILTEVDVLEIRRLHRAGVPKRQIARLFGVSKGNVQFILTGKTWHHVPDEFDTVSYPSFVARRERRAEPRRITDGQWEVLWPIIDTCDIKRWRLTTDVRGIVDAIIYHDVTGEAWNTLPEWFPDDATVYLTYQRWCYLGLMSVVMSALQAQSVS